MNTDLNMEYQEVKFGEIAKHISKRVEPSETTLGVYVGLEHLDPDSLKITRHGVPSDVAGQKLLVKKGQIIFGKRRAYQRKVAVADWDCICSAHAMVLEAIPGKILPDFLPLFMQSNQFMERAVGISEGSLSPTIKWKNLEQQSFVIPNIDFQEKAIELSKMIDKCLILNEESIKLAEILYENLSIRFSNKNETLKLEDLCLKIQDGTHFSPKKIDKTGEYLYVTSKNIRMGYMEFNDKDYISFDEHKAIYARCDVQEGDILLTKDGANTGNICINECKSEISLLSSVAFIRVDDTKLDKLFLYHYLMSAKVQREIKAQMAGNAITRLTLKKIKNLLIPDINLEEQKNIANIMNKQFLILKNLKEKRINLLNLNKAYMQI
ncbi:restriction endonuclease subunit S [Acinetobacter baumannii]